ncbi:MAG TPA: hypothetical protein ENF55_01465 [Thermoprotei archaeon]|nr:MAG: hypothetical protein DRJ63_05455 [Thermoprotei archaeon]HDI74603.1 hypothetical protein [Thermoprotei archaeon]
MMRLRARIIRKLLRGYIRLSQGRRVVFRGAELRLDRVFNPKRTFSTDLLADYLESMNIREFVEIGTGSGALVISLRENLSYAVATDISVTAARCAKINFELNGISDKVDVVVADCLSCFRENSLSCIVFNPPYLPLNPVDEIDYALCCGENLEIYRKFFAGVCQTAKGCVYTTCSSLTGVNEILRLARDYGLKAKVLARKRTPLDTVYLIEVASEAI